MVIVDCVTWRVWEQDDATLEKALRTMEDIPLKGQRVRVEKVLGLVMVFFFCDVLCFLSG